MSGCKGRFAMASRLLVLRCYMAIFVPPLAVYLSAPRGGWHLALNFILTLLVVPGQLHALYFIIWRARTPLIATSGRIRRDTHGASAYTGGGANRTARRRRSTKTAVALGASRKCNRADCIRENERAPIFIFLVFSSCQQSKDAARRRVAVHKLAVRSVASADRPVARQRVASNANASSSGLAVVNAQSSLAHQTRQSKEERAVNKNKIV